MFSDSKAHSSPSSKSGGGFAIKATIAILALAACGSYGMHRISLGQREAAVERLQAEEHGRTQQYADISTNALKQIYQNIRTLSFLPDIRSLDRHASNVGEGSRQTIQQVYNNLASNVSVSEVYFVPAEFKPGAMDPKTGKPEEPAMMYDQLIAGDDAVAEEGGAEDGQPEVEDEEYALIAKQIAYFKQKYPTSQAIEGMNVPMVSGPAVVTCDNTDFNKTLNEYDRKGIVFSVPYYGRDGKLGGVVSVIVRLRVLEKILPVEDAVLVNVGEKYGVFSRDGGQATLSAEAALKGSPDSSLVYSEAMPLDVPDMQAQWTLWRGLSNEKFETSPEIAALHTKEFITHGLIWALALMAAIVTWIADLRFIRPAKAVVHALVEIAGGKIETEVPLSNRRDLLGDISRAVTRFKDDAQQLQEAESERARQVQREMLLQAEREADARGHAASVTTVVEQLGAGLKRLAECNISKGIEQPFSEEFDLIRHDFNRSIAAFQVTLEQVLMGTVDIRESSLELSNGAAGMSLRSEQQAAAVEQTAAALEQISVTVKELSQRAEATRTLASDASRKARESGTIVSEAITAMERIEQSAAQISQIISVINGIAFQTNLLALNAGVEAARAGEAGKGFAVVALEVRELAQRSASASQQIQALIEGSTREVQQGVGLVRQTGGALQEISEYVVSIDGNVDAITTGIREQSASLSETSAAIQQLDGTTQQNAAMAEETAALSKVLNQQAESLAEQVQKFKLSRRATTRERVSNDTGSRRTAARAA